MPDDEEIQSPFKGETIKEVVVDEPAEGAPESIWDKPAEAEATTEEADDSYGKFETPSDDAKPKHNHPIPQKRLNKVIGERNEAREALAAAEVRLAAAEARAETLEQFQKVVDAHYRENPGLLDFDARFMEKFAEMAEADPTIANVANHIKAAMSGEERPNVTTENTQAEEQEVEDFNPAVAKILERDVTRQINEVLTESGVKQSYVKAVARDVLNAFDVEELADATPEDIVEMAKVYFEETGVEAKDFLVATKKGSKAPATTSGRRPAVSESAATEHADATERKRPKTLEEYEKGRDARFKAAVQSLTNR